MLLSLDQMSERQYDQIYLTISSDEPGLFTIDASVLGMSGGSVDLRIEDLLEAQFSGQSSLSLMDRACVVNLNLLIHLINKSECTRVRRGIGEEKSGKEFFPFVWLCADWGFPFLNPSHFSKNSTPDVAGGNSALSRSPAFLGYGNDFFLSRFPFSFGITSPSKHCIRAADHHPLFLTMFPSPPRTLRSVAVPQTFPRPASLVSRACRALFASVPSHLLDWKDARLDNVFSGCITITFLLIRSSCPAASSVRKQAVCLYAQWGVPSAERSLRSHQGSRAFGCGCDC